MKVVKYVGYKPQGMKVPYPIGAKSKGTIKEHKLADPYLELPDHEAEKLVQIDPRNFVIETDEPQAQEHQYQEPVEKKRGRKPKSEEVG